MSKGKKIYCIASFAFACAVLILTITLCMMHPGRVYASSMDPAPFTNEGKQQVVDWINAQYEDHPEKWSHEKKNLY